MLLTVTLNTAVDKLYLVEDVRPDTVMRVKEVSNTAGGKGLNVSKVAALAGEPVRAMGFLGGFNGQYVRSLLRAQGIADDFVEIDAETRSCINIRNLATGKHTEYLEPGASVTRQNLDDFLQRFETALPDCDAVTISGSVPKGTPASFYGQLTYIAKAAGKPVILDTSGELLIHGVEAQPTMIKPNDDEIAQLLGEPVSGREALVAAAQRLLQGGVSYIVVSMGKAGSLMVCEDGVFQGHTPDIPVVNTVGCGDSMVAGFAVGMLRGYSAAEMLKFATAISTANALTIQTGYFEQKDLQRLLGEVSVTKL